MPDTNQARKNLRKDKTRQIKNDALRGQYKTAVKKVKKSPTPKNLSEASKIIDKAAGKNLIHANKAARLKSRMAKSAKAKK
jgi:small subunit ribosomal protein S20